MRAPENQSGENPLGKTSPGFDALSMVADGYESMYSDLDSVLDRLDDPLDRVVDRNAVVLVAASVSERNRTSFDVLVADDDHERNFLRLRVADLLLHALVGMVDLDADAPRLQLGGDVVEVVGVALGHRDADHLNRGEPRWERPGVVLDEHTDEPFDRPELRRVDHDRLPA